MARTRKALGHGWLATFSTTLPAHGGFFTLVPSAEKTKRPCSPVQSCLPCRASTRISVSRPSKHWRPGHPCSCLRTSTWPKRLKGRASGLRRPWKQRRGAGGWRIYSPVPNGCRLWRCRRGPGRASIFPGDVSPMNSSAATIACCERVPSMRTAQPMPASPPVSCLIYTLNEEINLPHCLASLRWCDDVVVVDSFSTDATAELARAAGAQVVQHAFTGFGDQRNWSLESVTLKHPWALILDADERVPPELVAEMAERLPPARAEVAAFRVRRRFYLW